MTKILVAGASGYLGRNILEELDNWRIPAIALVRAPEKLKDLNHGNIKVVKAEVTRPETLRGVCKDVETVISTVGITRQKDGLTYMDVDYQANLNLLKEAQRTGVRKFVYVSVIDGGKLRHLKITKAKERFVDALKASGLEYTVIRPNGFFSDLRYVLYMAEKGRVVLFGNGELKLNPIHGADLAEVCVRAIAQKDKEIAVGGPDILTQNEIAEMALCAWNKPGNNVHLPGWIRLLILNAAKIFLPEKKFGPLEFFLTLMSGDSIATRYGKHRLQDFFNQEVQQIKQQSNQK
ncbi:SDR family oxidoreductase [Gracilimonas sediminicola]|uniref:SDR family oxidoreductase n=1 Tax=Gracilimonas sediminicola TaxID=2952158 RepID=UPI0038D43878